MNKAIENYAFGKQKEVIAWRGESVPASSQRFFCPECLESVALDRRGHFRHKNRTAQSLECEKRVDSTNRTSYERMGLPFYMVEQAEECFFLYIGFSAVLSEELEKSSKKGAYLYISNGVKEKKKYLVSKERFNTDTYTLLKVDTIPNQNGRFLIEYSNNVSRSIQEQWTTQTDTWGIGQFFKSIGDRYRKIRPLGTIVTDTEYLFIGDIWYLKNYKSIVTISKYGNLILGSKRLPVYRIMINGENEKIFELKRLSQMLIEKYKINLLMAESDISPIWPPCVIDDNYCIFDSNCQEAFFAINSPNENPVIYRYYGGYSSVLPTDDINPHILRLKLTDNDIPISVDRVFNGNVQYIRRSRLTNTFSEYSADIVDYKNESIIGNLLPGIKGQKYKIVASCTSTVYLVALNGTAKRYRITDAEGAIITDIHWGDTVFVFSQDWSCILKYVFSYDGEHQEENQHLLLIMQLHGLPLQKVDAVTKTYCVKAGQDPKLQKYIAKYLRTKQIPVAVAKAMKEKYGGY